MSDVDQVREALMIGRSHLPIFAADRRKVERAQEHLVAMEEGDGALDRIIAERDSLLARLSAAEQALREIDHLSCVIRGGGNRIERIARAALALREETT